MEISNTNYIADIHEYCKEIYGILGYGYKEHIYVNAMCYHLRENNYLFGSEVIVPINYNNIQVGFTRADIIIYSPIKCVLEFKALTNNVTKKEFNQLNQYINNLDVDYGVLINFSNNLEFKTLIKNN